MIMAGKPNHAPKPGPRTGMLEIKKSTGRTRVQTDGFGATRNRAIQNTIGTLLVNHKKIILSTIRLWISGDQRFAEGQKFLRLQLDLVKQHGDKRLTF